MVTDILGNGKVVGTTDGINERIPCFIRLKSKQGQTRHSVAREVLPGPTQTILVSIFFSSHVLGLIGDTVGLERQSVARRFSCAVSLCQYPLVVGPCCVPLPSHGQKQVPSSVSPIDTAPSYTRYKMNDAISFDSLAKDTKAQTQQSCCLGHIHEISRSRIFVVFLASLYPETSIPFVVILLIIMVASENTPLILESGGHNGHGGGAALASKTTFTTLLGTIQLILTLCFLFGTGYDPKDYSAAEYVIFRDIAVMLFLGFGFLMTFLGKNTTMTEKRK
jgi:hypothetical protein